MMNQHIASWYEAHGQEVKDLSKQLWELSETALEEYESCRLTAAFMEKYGFSVETFNCSSISDKPANTVVATWGSGKPVIGIIGEYDGLPGLGQEVKPYRAPKEGNGQGCGHSLMAPACGSAAIALKTAMEAEGLSGTVKFFACPAEETVEAPAERAVEQKQSRSRRSRKPNKAAEQKTEQPKKEQPKREQPKAEQPKKEQPKKGQPKKEQPQQAEKKEGDAPKAANKSRRRHNYRHHKPKNGAEKKAEQ